MPAPTVPTAAGDLAPFVDAARSADSRLREAAALINGAVRSTAVVVDARTVAAVQAAEPEQVAATIPPGMPEPLLRAVLLTYSDLVSRYAAISSFRIAAGTYPREEPSADEMIGCLANGSPAAARFDADLGAVATSAGETPPVGGVDPASLAAAELAVRLADIELRNVGCGSCGGYVSTTFVPIRWDDAAPGLTARSGLLGDVRFEAVQVSGGGWTAELNAC
ncbi:hypothetical protein [Pengzhenrongella frigida]|uniref:Uncharacterized protein n=1 Tax=Pengzhenrongella frigida TaxID=1259133 RepID=A0A4Q5N2E1_9MICO|nr:hypothetical protein [Cellulomonas sp. HLT2-17]RYV52285.1 hypothetical protein EUA98_03480 [Cellulomonas sp. HLT2-17]